VQTVPAAQAPQLPPQPSSPHSLSVQSKQDAQVFSRHACQSAAGALSVASFQQAANGDPAMPNNTTDGS